MGKTTTDMQLVPIDKLVPYVNNARTHSPEQITKLRSSLREFGFVNPIIIDLAPFLFVNLHGRLICMDDILLKKILLQSRSEWSDVFPGNIRFLRLQPVWVRKVDCIVLKDFLTPGSNLPQRRS